MLKPLKRAGDTIVEVLIVTVVIGMVLASAYAIAVRSLQDTQLSQERAFALKLAEAQLENLRAAASSAASVGALTKSNGFCLDSNLAPTDLNGGAPATDAVGSNFGDNYPGACHIDPNNLSCASYCYYISLMRVPSSAPDDRSYTATVHWYGPRGVLEQVQLSYKVYQNV
jgi:type II secretory pathway pseudopilin PulG